MYPYFKRMAFLSFAIATMFWVGCSKSGNTDNTPATTQLYQAYKACKARTGGQSVMYAYCYSSQDAYNNCDCVSDMQVQSIASFKGTSTNGNMYSQYGMNGDEQIINSYIAYANQAPADAKRRLIDAWNKIGTTNAGGYNPYGQQGYNPYLQQQQQQYYNNGYGGYCDPRTGVCLY